MLISAFFPITVYKYILFHLKLLGSREVGMRLLQRKFQPVLSEALAKLFLLHKNQRDMLKMRSTKEKLKLESNCIESKKLNLNSCLCEYLTKYWFFFF